MSSNSKQQRIAASTVIRLLLSVFSTAFANCTAHAETANVIVFKAGEDGYHSYRIPVIVRAKNGDLLAFAEGRKNNRNDHGDIDIVLKRSGDHGKSWGAMEVVQDEEADPTGKVWIGNPTPVVDLLDPEHAGRIWLVFTRSNQQMFVISSDDNGETWSKRREITPAVGKKDWHWYAAGPVHAIQLIRGPHAGRLVIPCDHRFGEKDNTKDAWGSHLVYSDDHGQTWKLGAADTQLAADPLHPNECVAVELVDGRIYVNARQHQGSDPAKRTIAYSSDGGETFDAPFVAEPQITSPIVQNSLIRFAARDQGDDENLLVYCGPGHPKDRRDLTILTSRDEGKTWKQKTVINRGPAAYCDLVKLSDKEVGVLYEAGKMLYGEILFATVALDELMPEK
jgi:sialidase-1